MFERRLKIVLILPVFCGVVILGRLFSLQVLNAGYYSQKIQDALIAPRQYLPPLRGNIIDRNGVRLVSDEPAHDVTVHYGALSMDDRYLSKVAERIRRRRPELRGLSKTELKAEATKYVAAMWLRLEEITGIPLARLCEQRDAICTAVQNLRKYLHKVRRGQGSRQQIENLHLREDEQFHPIIRDVSAEVRTRIELEFSEMPFIRVDPSVRRVWSPDTSSVCHILGRMGQVPPEFVRDDPNCDDPLAAYRVDDEAGISGVERLCEAMLRGKRGYEVTYLDHRVKERVPPQDGLDVQLTIDLGMQRTIEAILSQAVAEQPHSTGGSCVVIDVETREIIAMVSVPTYDIDTLRQNYGALRDNTRGVPLRFRAVSEEYQPGSILKPVALLAGLSAGVFDSDTQVYCDGSLFADSDKWHCWTYWRGLAGHSQIAAEEAIQHSCNIYFYTLGQKLGGDRLTDFYARFLHGPGGTQARTGTGLIEERSGIIPTPEWMREKRKRSLMPADARNYAIGQGEMQFTPLCAANIYATLASGVFREPTLIANDARPRPAYEIPVSPRALELTRRGLYRCVNEEGGTASRFAKLDSIELCGKTGSAQCVSRVTSWRFTFEDEEGRQSAVTAPTIEAAREYANLPGRVRCIRREIVDRFPKPDPEKGKIPTHAWFAGFAPYRSPKVAFAIIVEYGGGGGNTAGPVARAVIEALMAAGYLPGPPGVAQLDPIR